LPGQQLGHGLRITIGTEEEMRGLAATMRELVIAAS
jgi:histidinol-phosphate aminotransferase